MYYSLYILHKTRASEATTSFGTNPFDLPFPIPLIHGGISEPLCSRARPPFQSKTGEPIYRTPRSIVSTRCFNAAMLLNRRSNIHCNLNPAPIYPHSRFHGSAGETSPSRLQSHRDHPVSICSKRWNHAGHRGGYERLRPGPQRRFA
jgi:hypothetical protein